MANIFDAYPDKYLRATDLHGSQPVVTIDHVLFEEIGTGNKKERKPVVYFRGKSKGLILNKTNAKKLAALLGSAETDDWVGQQVRLYPTEVEYSGDSVEAIRIKPAGPQNHGAQSRQPPPPPPRPAVVEHDDFSDPEPPPPDDEVPF